MRILFTGILFFSFLISHLSQAGSAHALLGMKEGDPPRSVRLPNLRGEIVDVSAYYGEKPVILVFWKLMRSKVYLDYSLDVLRFLQGFYEKHSDKTGLEIFAVYTPESGKEISADEIESVRNLIQVNKIKFPVLLDRGFRIFQEYGVIALPTTILIDKTSRITFIYPSFPIAARPVLSEKIMDLIGVARVARKEEDKEEADSQAKRLYYYARQMYKRGFLEQSLSPLQKAISLDHEFSSAHNLMGIILRERGKFALSQQEFKKAIELDNNNKAAHLNYSVLLIEKGQYDEAEKILKSFPWEKEELTIRARYLLGFIHKKMGRIDEAVKELESAYRLIETRTAAGALRSDSYHAFRLSVLYELSELHRSRRNEKKSLSLLREAVRIALDLPEKNNHGFTLSGKELMIYE